MPTQTKTHIMFQGDGDKAIDLYSSVFKDFKIEDKQTYAEGEGPEVGSFKLANVSFAGHNLIVLNSPPVHKFNFTPSMSLFVDFGSQAEFDAAFQKLSEGGEVMMPPGNYGFSQQFAWFKDGFGLSWQLNLP